MLNVSNIGYRTTEHNYGTCEKGMLFLYGIVHNLSYNITEQVAMT